MGLRSPFRAFRPIRTNKATLCAAEKERRRAETMAALLLGPFGLLRGQGTQESQQGDAAGQRPPNTACVELENFANAQYTAQRPRSSGACLA